MSLISENGEVLELCFEGKCPHFGDCAVSALYGMKPANPCAFYWLKERNIVVKDDDGKDLSEKDVWAMSNWAESVRRGAVLGEEE